jgi:ammonia channel protein AmtB
MNTNKNLSGEQYSKRKNGYVAGASGTIYGLAFIGAAFYFISHATTFLMGVLGFIKALFWPAVLIYKLLEFLKM